MLQHDPTLGGAVWEAQVAAASTDGCSSPDGGGYVIFLAVTGAGEAPGAPVNACWADGPTASDVVSRACNTGVSPDDPLGLCLTHRREILDP